MLWICTARTDLLYTNHSHPYLKGPILFGHTLSCSDTSILVGVDARKWNTLYLTERVSQNVTELLVDRIMLAGRGRGFCFFVSFGQLWPLSWPEVMKARGGLPLCHLVKSRGNPLWPCLLRVERVWSFRRVCVAQELWQFFWTEDIFADPGEATSRFGRRFRELRLPRLLTIQEVTT